MNKLFYFLSSAFFLTFAFSTAEAQGINFNGIGGRLGFVKPENIDGTFGIGFHTHLGEIVPNLVLYPSLEYWGKSRGGVDFSQLALNGDLRYYFPLAGDANVDVFAGGGLGILLNDPGDNDIGLNVLGGIDVPFSGNWVAGGEIRFVINDNTLFKIMAGITYMFGK